MRVDASLNTARGGIGVVDDDCLSSSSMTLARGSRNEKPISAISPKPISVTPAPTSAPVSLTTADTAETADVSRRSEEEVAAYV